jgi:hypothetical protein
MLALTGTAAGHLLRMILRLGGASPVLTEGSDDEREEAEQQAQVGPIDLAE